MKFDVMGRIRNMDLPDGKTAVLYSVYEAVSNSIHAIIDRFGDAQAAEQGKIRIEIELDDDSEVDSITVSDNGIGFNPDNLESFETSDSSYKYTRGGKGVGRLVWIKTFKDIHVTSRYAEGDSILQNSFQFKPEVEPSVIGYKVKPSKKTEPGSVIKISNPRGHQGGRMNQATFMKDLALHFFALFITGALPEIELIYNGESRLLREFIEDKADNPVRTKLSFEVGGESWEVNVDHIYVDPNISTELRNSYLLTAHGRLVGDPVSVERKYALKELPGGKAYVAVVSGKPLDERVDQQRLGFRFNATQKEALEHAILEGIEHFLAGHIAQVRTRQRRTVESILMEHPQLSSQIENIDEYVAGLFPGMDDEQIGQNLFVLLYREEKEARKRLAELSKSDRFTAEQKAEAESTLKELSEQEKRRLAELVVKRHQVLEAANMLLKYSDEEKEKYFYEKVVHELICPMGAMLTSGDYEEHNLWIVDEALSGYEFFASDKTIRSLVGPGGSTKEPDIIFFNPLGVRRPNTNDPVSIVEFKRPGDEAPSKHPVDQVLEYIEELRGHSVRGVDGEVVSDISPDTPFNCYIVCELTDATRKILERSVAQTPTPDGQGYYGWSKPHNAAIQVVSFQKMIRDAMARNRVFFDALNLANPSATARKRAARAREKRQVEVRVS